MTFIEVYDLVINLEWKTHRSGEYSFSQPNHFENIWILTFDQVNLPVGINFTIKHNKNLLELLHVIFNFVNFLLLL